jgi:5-methylcytosine-specific restriction endonuclease McrA
VARTGHKRRTKIKTFKNDLTSKQWDDILKMQNNHCSDCGREFGEKLIPRRDHIYPVSSKFSLIGGLTFGNVQALCAPCNSKKGTSIPFLKFIFELADESINMMKKVDLVPKQST